MKDPSERIWRAARELSIPNQEAAMLCCEARARTDAERLTRKIEEIMDTPEEDGD